MIRTFLVVQFLFIIFIGSFRALSSPLSNICLKNKAPFVMHWKLADLTNQATSKDSGRYPVDQERCINLDAIPNLNPEDAIVAKVSAIAGHTIMVPISDVLYSNSSETVSFSCRGTTTKFHCSMDNYCAAASGAAGDDTLKKSSAYNGVFKTWSNSVLSCAPDMTPHNDKELVSFLKYAQSKNYRVRPSGATHSAGPLVTNATDENTVVLSLAKYTPSVADWDFSLDNSCVKDPTKECFVKIGAGYSWLDLYQRVRPQGLFPPTQTAGYFFQIGGIVANSVHGGVYNRSFVHRYVTKMRVLTADGNFRIISTEDELGYWRSSFGLLGIITAVEFKLEYRKNFVQYIVDKVLPEWNQTEFWKFVLQSAEGDLPPQSNISGSRLATMSDVFIDFYDNRMMSTQFKIGSAAITNNPPDPNLTSAHISEEYLVHQTSYPSIRLNGCPPDLDYINKILKDIPFSNSKEVATLMCNATYSKLLGIPKTTDDQRAVVNDGFYALEAPNTAIAAWFIPLNKTFDAFNIMRQIVQEHFNHASLFKFNQPAEFRFVEVDAEAVVLSNVKSSGTYMVCELLAFTDSSTRGGWQEAFKEVEDAWLALGAKPHLGKLFSFDINSQGKIVPFQDSKTALIITLARKCKFESYRQKYDPNRLFFAGYGTNLLKVCDNNDCVTNPPRPLDFEKDCHTDATFEQNIL